MAPELILALIEDDCSPPTTTASDVYSFACICLEVIRNKLSWIWRLILFKKIATGQVPFPNRKNDHAVTVDIMHGIRPSRGTSCHIECHNEGTFWEMLDQCWDPVFHLRPSMSEVITYLQGQMKSPTVSQRQWFMYNSTQPAWKY